MKGRGWVSILPTFNSRKHFFCTRAQIFSHVCPEQRSCLCCSLFFIMEIGHDTDQPLNKHLCNERMNEWTAAPIFQGLLNCLAPAIHRATVLGRVRGQGRQLCRQRAYYVPGTSSVHQLILENKWALWMFSAFPMMKLRLRQATSLAQGHMSRKEQSCDCNPRKCHPNLTAPSQGFLSSLLNSDLSSHFFLTSSGSESLNSQPSPVQLIKDWQDLSVSNSRRNCHSWIGPLPGNTRHSK